MSNAARKRIKFAAVQTNRINYLNRLVWFDADGDSVRIEQARHTMMSLFSQWSVNPNERKFQTWMGRKVSRILHPLFSKSFTQQLSRFGLACVRELSYDQISERRDEFTLRFETDVEFHDHDVDTMSIRCTGSDRHLLLRRFNVTITFRRPSQSFSELTPISIRNKTASAGSYANPVGAKLYASSDVKAQIDRLIGAELSTFANADHQFKAQMADLDKQVKNLILKRQDLETKIRVNNRNKDAAVKNLLGDWFPK